MRSRKTHQADARMAGRFSNLPAYPDNQDALVAPGPLSTPSRGGIRAEGSAGEARTSWDRDRRQRRPRQLDRNPPAEAV